MQCRKPLINTLHRLLESIISSVWATQHRVSANSGAFDHVQYWFPTPNFPLFNKRRQNDFGNMRHYHVFSVMTGDRHN